MKLQHMIIIFLIIMLPLALIMSQYTSLQIDTLSAKTKYDTALLGATFDTMSALELNTVNNKTSSVVGEEIRDLEAVISTFATSLSSSLGMSNASTDYILSYVPAIVFGLYDGYYIYAQNDTGTGRELKPYVYYTKTYSNGSTNITIAYSLDNYVSIYGEYIPVGGGGKEIISASGYLVNPDDIRVSNNFAYVSTIDSDGKTTKKVIDPGTESGGQKSWIKYKGYDITPETIYENETASKTDEMIVNKAKYSTEAMMYYYEAKQFTDLYNRVINSLIPRDKNTLYIYRDNDPEDEYSPFMNEKINVMMNSITKNLNIAIYNYEGAVSDNYEMPQLKGEDWEKILNNISITAFLKDIQVGATKYNNYVVVNSTTNQKYSSAKSIDFIEYVNDAQKGLTSYGYYHKITCDRLIKDIESGTISEIIGYASVDFEKYRYSPEDSSDYYYYYKHNEYANYECEVEAIENQNVATIEKYIRGKTTDNNTRNKILKSYYTAVGRIRYGLVKASSYINLDKAKNFTVRYYPNGGSWSKGNPERETTTIGKLSTISETPRVTGKLFMGWSTNPNAKVAEVKVGDIIYGQEGKTIDLYAVYANQYTVTYHMNGGEGGPSPNVQTKISGVDYAISTSKPRRDGRDFLGWSTNPSATTAEYVAGDTYSEDRDLVLYAVWTNQTVKIYYHAEAGRIVATQEKAVGATIKLLDTIPTRIGSTFIGWSTKLNGTPEYQPGSDYSENINRNLYAVWNDTTFRITYNGNGGDLPADLQNPSKCTKSYGLGYIISDVKPVRNGYTFIGWSKDPNDLAPDNNYAPGSVYTENANLTLYAIWEGNQYWVVYDANGGTNAPETQTTTKDKNLTITNNKPNREGYKFLGWSSYVHASESQVEYRAGVTYSERTSVRLYAVWKLATYTITYDTNGGSPTPVAQTKKHGQNLHITSTQPSKTNYYFVGWSKNRDSKTADYYTNQVYRENESVTLYAVWSVSGYYSIIYHSNGGTGEPDPQEDIPVGTSTTISMIRPTRDGYTFQGWSTSASATVADNKYAPESVYTENADLTLYAVWKANGQSLTVNPNGGTWRDSKSSTAIPLSVNSITTIENPIPPAGYVFKEWTLTSGDAYIWPTTSGSYQVAMQLSSSTIVARYEKDYYKLTYNSNSSTPVGNMPGVVTVKYNTQITLASNIPTRDGYKFLGWSEDPTATTATYQAGDLYTMPVYHVTLYAIWEKQISKMEVLKKSENSYWTLRATGTYSGGGNGFSDTVSVYTNDVNISNGTQEINCTGYTYMKVRFTGDVEEGGPNTAPNNYVSVGVGKDGETVAVRRAIHRWGPGQIGSGKEYYRYNSSTNGYDVNTNEGIVYVNISDLQGSYNFCIKAEGDRFGGPWGNIKVTEITLCSTLESD